MCLNLNENKQKRAAAAAMRTMHSNKGNVDLIKTLTTTL